MPKKADTFTFKGFCDIFLNAAEKERLAAWDVDEIVLDEMITNCLIDGYSLGQSFDDSHDCWVASLTGKRCGGPNQGFVLNGRSNSRYGALKALFFRHFELVGSDGEWAARTTPKLRVPVD